MCIFPCKSHSLNHVSGARAGANHVSAAVMNYIHVHTLRLLNLARHSMHMHCTFLSPYLPPFHLLFSGDSGIDGCLFALLYQTLIEDVDQ